MYTQIAPSGVTVYSSVPFHKYTAWDNVTVLFHIRSQYMLRKSHTKKIIKAIKARKAA